MIKQIGLYGASFVLLSFIVYFAHTIGLATIANQTPIPLKEVYLFHAGFSLLLCINFIALSRNQKFRDQLGFLYLVSVALKIILFCLVFYKAIFQSDSFTNIQSSNLLIPMALYLILEVLFISKLLKNMTPLKNDE